MNRVYLKVCVGLISSLLSVSVFAQQIKNAELQQLSENLQQYLNSQNAIEQYHAYKAQIWLSYAKNEFSENSLTVAGQEAFEQSRSLVKKLSSTASENNQLTTSILSVSQVMRRDLWWQLEYFKQNGAINTEPQALAEAEVMLVWAAAEYCELGWRHAKEHFFAVEQRLYQIKQSLPEIEPISLNMEDLPTFEALNGKGCQGVNSKFWPLKLQEVPSNKQTPQENVNTEISIDTLTID